MVKPQPAERKPTPAQHLIRDVALLQLKLLLDALRDVVLSPITLGAAAIDLLLSGQREPRLFRAALRMGERSDAWIDLWSAARERDAPHARNVDDLLAIVEQALADPKTSARRARVLRRWAERQARRGGRRIVDAASARLPGPPKPPGTDDGGRPGDPGAAGPGTPPQKR